MNELDFDLNSKWSCNINNFSEFSCPKQSMLIVMSPLPLLGARIQSVVDVHCELYELIYVDSVCVKD